jgi:hypothetical protein
MAVTVFNLRASGRRRAVQSTLGELADALGDKATVWVPKHEDPDRPGGGSWVTKPRHQKVELSFDVEVHAAEQLDQARSLVVEALKRVDPEAGTISYAGELEPSARVA